MRRLAGAIAAVVVLSAISVAPASAASTRTEYVAQVDPICQEARERWLKPEARYFKESVRVERVEEGKQRKRALNRLLRMLAKVFAVRARVETSASSQIATVPPAPGDESIVATWLEQRRQWTSGLSQLAAPIRHHRYRAFSRLAKQAEMTRKAANATVAGFGFQNCVWP
jgi:hypothetical protein